MAENFLSPDETRRVVSGHMPALDGLRGVAILLVLITHLVWAPIELRGFPRKVLDITSVGWIGVDLFFVLSGFLITGILLDSKGAANYFASFYARRALRILPLYYGVLFVTFVLVPLLGRAGVPHLPRQFNPDQIWYWFYAGNWAWSWNHAYGPFVHFWSLAVEEQFYFVWPWIVLMTSRKTLARLCAFLLVLAPVLRGFLYLRGRNPEFIYSSTWSYLDILALGALTALVVRNERWMQRVVPHIKWLFWVGLAVFIGFDSFNQEMGAYGPAFIYGVLPLSISFAALLLWALVTTGSPSRIQSVLNWGWLRAYGKYSYSIYLFHPILFDFVDNRLLGLTYDRFHTSRFRGWFHHQGPLSLAIMGILFTVNLLADCLIMLGVGKLSWWAFEGPINRLKSRFKIRQKDTLPSVDGFRRSYSRN